jgi:hypothetical protein
MEPNPDKLSTDNKETKSSFYSWSIKLATGAIGLFGISGILYGVGFLVMRSHYSFLGVWSGIPLKDTEMIVEEGGRFFYHLLYSLVSPLIDNPINYILSLLAIALAWKAIDKFYYWVKRRYAKHFHEFFRKINLILSTLFFVTILIGSILLLHESWKVAGWQGVLHSCNLEHQADNSFCSCVNNSDCSNDTYIRIVWSAVIGIAISWVLYQQFWQRQEMIQRILIAMQWLIVIAAVGIIPVAYGKLMMPLSYPSLILPNKTSSEILLLAHTPSTWFVWNIEEKRTEIIPRNDQERAIIGQKKSILH